ncbi:type I secretion C-terminal target domain-containing protein [Phenylobacterium sp.]|jgi:Ca2+-binding RTX toxin-like protein|uniref:type I secretion C-terminal target domain-containing protein n=1 Tax=Phenylobacterium sp. TaxID=1871053 RepID=UPI002F92ED3A
MPTPGQDGELTYFTNDAAGRLQDPATGIDMSADGRYGVWTAEVNGLHTVVLKDLVRGWTTTLWSGNGHTFHSELSASGRYMSFFSHSTDLGGGRETDGEADIYLRDITNGSLHQVSNLLASPAYLVSEADVADNARTVFSAKLGSSSAADQVIVIDPISRTTLYTSTNATGGVPNGASIRARISDDGRYVTFVSSASDLVGGDTNGVRDVFRKDLATGELARVSMGPGGAEANGASEWTDISADGRYVVFSSAASNLVAGDSNGRADVFVKDLQTGQLTLASRDGGGFQFSVDMWQPSISGDGRFVSFQATSGSSLYVRDLQTGEFYTYDQYMGPFYAHFAGNLLTFRGDPVSADLPYGGYAADFDLRADPEANVETSDPTFTLQIGSENVLAVGRFAQSITGNNLGNVLTSNDYGSTLNGGAGADTLVGGRSQDVLTGGAGADVFKFNVLPWGAGRVSDFTTGADRLDLSAIFQAHGYSGSDPVADGWVRFEADGVGGTRVMFDANGPASGGDYPYQVTTLSGVAHEGLTWATVGAGPPSSGPPPAQTTIAFSTPTLARPEGQSGGAAFDFIVTRTGPTSGTSQVNWTAAGTGDVRADVSDFAHGGQEPRGTLTFGPGETEKVLTVNVSGDTVLEGDETFTVSLSGPTGAMLGAAVRAVGTITNDDAPPPSTGSGQIYTSPGPGSTLAGGSGDDTLNASQGADVLTGAGGADRFVFAKEPWAPARITDFALGTDKLDLSGMLQASGYSGSDPIGDKHLWIIDDGQNGSKLLWDRDAAGPSPQWPNYFLHLEKVPSAGLTWTQLSASGGNGGGEPPPPSGQPGVVLTSSRYGDTLTGGAGDDTLIASQTPDRLIGAGGADHFVYGDLPWNAGRIADFTPGTDKLDLRGIFQDASYTGSNPLADGTLAFRSDGAGSTQVYFDRDAPNTGDWPFLITTLEGVAPGQIGPDDWLFR